MFAICHCQSVSCRKEPAQTKSAPIHPSIMIVGYQNDGYASIFYLEFISRGLLLDDPSDW